jgi:hypothetical protein
MKRGGEGGGVDHKRWILAKMLGEMVVSSHFSGDNLAAVIAIQFFSSSVSDNVPCLQVLIYPVVQSFDFMAPSYRTPALHIFHFGRGAEQVLGALKIFTFTLDEIS